MLGSNILMIPLLRIVQALRSQKEVIQGSIACVSVIIPAYNEAKNIIEKIDTVRRALQMINVEWEVLIGSDGSTDGTDEIAREHVLHFDDNVRWRILSFDNEGKGATLNKLVTAARGDLIISTDADIPVPEDSLAIIVRAFQNNAGLGCLSCVPGFEGLDIGSQKSYWSIEDKIRQAESKVGKLIVVTGMVYAYRKELFKEIPNGVMADDLWVPLNVLLKGYDCRQQEKLLVPYEKTDEKYEVQRRKRVMVGGMDVIRRLWPSLIEHPLLLLIVLFHKVNRWALPLWVFTIVVASVALWPFLAMAYLAGGAILFLVLGRDRFLTIVYSIFSPVLSFVEVVKKKDFARWERIS